MYKIFQNYFRRRNFSSSGIWKNSEKSKSTEPETILKYDFIPNKFEKKVLLWSGKYTKDTLPARISKVTLSNAKSVVRIKVATLMMILGCVIFGAYVLEGKRKVKEMHKNS